MSNQYSAGPRLTDGPVGDPKRQAIASLRGYAYQLYASALAWLDLRQGQQLYLEVAEDYAVAAAGAFEGVQVKDTAQSGTVTINSEDVREAIDGFVDLVQRNPGAQVTFRFLSTSEIGRERSTDDRAGGAGVLSYWRKAAAGAEVAPLRAALEKVDLSQRVKQFINERNDDELRAELLKKIHWDCGRPDLFAIKAELTESLIEFGSERFQLVPSDCETLTAVILERVLSTVLTPGARRMVAADLLKLCEEHTRISVPKAAVNTLLQKLANAPTATSILAIDAPSTLESEFELPLPSGLTERRRLITEVRQRVGGERLLFLTGGTGLGKTIVARLAARASGGSWYVLDLRDATANECVRRLRRALGQISTLLPAGLILDDLNEAEGPAVWQELSRLLCGLHRRDAVCLITSYRDPSTSLLDRLGATAEAVLRVPSFNVDEVGELVAAAGGDRAIWANHVHWWGGMGHPQFVRALVSGLRSRRWPRGAIGDHSAHAAPNFDLEVERRAARQRLLAALQEEARTLLYRTSLLFGRFDRSLALHLAAIAPKVSLPGERLDTLVGPWIDLIGRGELRNSPLIANVGRETLLPAEQLSVHDMAAERLTAGNSIDCRHADAAFLHAIEGKCEPALVKLASAVVGAVENDRGRLVDWLPHLQKSSTESSIYAENSTISRLLRFAQLLVIAQTHDIDAIHETWRALVREMQDESESHLREGFEYVVLCKVLISSALAGVLPNWLSLLRRMDELTNSRKEWKDLVAHLETLSPQLGGKGISLNGMLFIMQAMGVQTVAEQARLFVALDELGTEARDRYLGQAAQMPSDYALLVNAAWLAETRKGSIDWLSAASSYLVMANQAFKWGYRELALRCHVARGVMFDEYGADGQAALDAIAEAESVLGIDPVLSRARAKVHLRHRRHADALASLGAHAAIIALDDPIERAFMCREAGISAPEIGNWAVASTWFGKAFAAAALTTSETMRPMVIGLRADAALATYRAGDTARAVPILSKALELLPTIDGDESTKAAYCQRVVRHGLLWMYGQATERDLAVDGEPPAMVAGMCSNPEPPETIRELQCASLDVAWYLMAEIESQHLDVAVAEANLAKRLGGKTVQSLELSTRTAFVANALGRLDVAAFMRQFGPWTDALAYLADHAAEMRSSDFIHPKYGEIPRASATQMQSPLVQRQIEDAILAFGMLVAMNGKGELLPALSAALGRQVGTKARGQLLAIMMAGGDSTVDARMFVSEAVHTLLVNERLSPEQLFGITLRFVQAIRQSAFSGVLVRRLAAWTRVAWHNAIVNRFAFRAPNITIPAVESALALQRDDLSSVAELLLAAESAVSVRLDSSLRTMLRSLVRN